MPSDDAKNGQSNGNKPAPVSDAVERLSKHESKPSNNLITKNPSSDKPLTEDDGDLLTSFSMTDKIGKDDDLMGTTEEINFLKTIPDPTEGIVDPSIVGDTDKAYDVISEVLENGLTKLDLSNRKLGDEFFSSMIESIIDFAEGEPLSVQKLYLANNGITDVGCDRICEFLIIEKDTTVGNISDIDLSNNMIKDKSVDIILTL